MSSTMYSVLDVICMVLVGGVAYTLAKRKNRDEIGWGIVAAVAFYVVGLASIELLAPRVGLVEDSAKALGYAVGLVAGAVVNVVLLFRPSLEPPIDKGAGPAGGAGDAAQAPTQDEGEAPAEPSATGEGEAPAEPSATGEGEAPAEPPSDAEAPDTKPETPPPDHKLSAAERPEPIPRSELTPEALARRFWPVAVPLAAFLLVLVPPVGRAVFGPPPDNPAADPRFFLLAPVFGVLFWRIRGRPLEGLLAGVLVLMYGPAIAWMNWRWGRGSSYYSHGYLIPLVVAWLVWLNRHRLARLQPQADLRWLGLAGLGGGLLLLVAGAFMRTYSVQGVSLVAVLAGGVCFLFGSAIARALWFPLAFVITMVPMPMHMVDGITFKLKTFAAKASVRVVDLLRAVGLHDYLVVCQGSYLRWEPTEEVLAKLPEAMAEKEAFAESLVAQGHAPDSAAVLEVEKGIEEMQAILRDGMDEIIIGDVCSGLRSLIALLAFGALFAYLSKMSLPKRLMLFAAAVPIAVLANMWRIVTLAFIACKFGSPATHGFVHDVTGYGIFAVAFVLFFGFERLLRSIGGNGQDDQEAAAAA
ncbi:MAG: archaeosortase/exosortase family protein [bacterium]